MSNALNSLKLSFATVLIVVAFGLGFYGTMTYVVPLSKGDVRQARASFVSDKTEVLINGAAISFEKGRHAETVKVLELALEGLISPSGEYKKINEWKLERIHFLMGKSYHLLEKYDKAVEAYQQTLRLNPDHLPAKYNLEMIKAQGGGKGSGKPKSGKQQPKI